MFRSIISEFRVSIIHAESFFTKYKKRMEKFTHLPFEDSQKDFVTPCNLNIYMVLSKVSSHLFIFLNKTSKYEKTLILLILN